MADIIVTTPKRRMAEAAREAEEIKAAGGGWYFRDYRAPRIPRVDVGDRVYYVEDGYIRGFCNVIKIDSVGYGRRRTVTVYMAATTWKWIRPIPVAPWEVVRSYMYAENFKLYGHRAGLSRENVEVVGGWLDPRPKAPLERD